MTLPHSFHKAEQGIKTAQAKLWLEYKQLKAAVPVQIALNEEDIKDRKQTIDEKINNKANSCKKLDEIQ